MDPISMMAVAGVASGVAGIGMQVAAANKAQAGANASAAATEAGTRAQADAIRAQAEADQSVAKQNQANAETKALEERAAAQRTAAEQIRTGRLMQSKLGAVAGASGSSGSDPTVMQLFSGIEKEAQRNASYDTATGNQRAQSISYQAALDRWTADANAGIKRRSADDTILGGQLTARAQRIGGQGAALSGYGGALGSISSMALKYGSTGSGTSKGYSY